MKNYQFKYNIGQAVYLRTDTEQREYLVIGINIHPTGHTYVLTNSGFEHESYELEISSVRNQLLVMGVEN